MERGRVAAVSGRPARPFTPKRQFRKEEDDMIMQMVNESAGCLCWEYIAGALKNRSARQCRERYCQYLRYPDLNTETWTAEEDVVLIEQVHAQGQKWRAIAPFFTGRSPVMVKNRWASLKRRNGGRRPELPSRASEHVSVHPVVPLTIAELCNGPIPTRTSSFPGLLADMESIPHQFTVFGSIPDSCSGFPSRPSPEGTA
jgi:hypothetical protein